METNIQTTSQEISDRWEALKQWGKDVIRVEQLVGVANDVWCVRIEGS